jgi:hypothetical protein
MDIPAQLNTSARRRQQIQHFIKKLNAVLFYVTTSAFSLSFLWLSASLLEVLVQSSLIPQGKKWVSLFSAFLLVAMNVSFLTLSTVMFMRAFIYKLWSITEEWERYWNILINALLILIFVGSFFLFVAAGIFIGAHDPKYNNT